MNKNFSRAVVAVAAWLGLVAGMVALAREAPTVFWVSSPVLPDETVYLQGAGLDASVKLSVSRVGDTTGVATAWRDVPTIQPAGTSLKFVLPPDLAPGVFAVRLAGEDGRAETMLNTPDCWWLQGDRGYERAAPGGWLRVFGRSLDLGDKASIVVLRNALGREVRVGIPSGKGDGYSLAVTLPADLAEGDYAVRVSNGHGGDQGWADAGTVKIVPAFAWPEKMYDVTAQGANGRDGLDDAPAIQAALDAAGKDGGGVVYLPRGQYHLGAMLTIPPGVTLRGESMETVALQWADRGATETKELDGKVGSGGSAVVDGFRLFKTGEPFRALIKGSDTFRVEELAIYAWSHLHGIEGDRGWDGKGNIHLKRVRMRLYSEGFHFGRAYKDAALEASARRERVKGLWYAGFQAGGRDLSVTDCDIACGEGFGLILDRAEGVRLCRNRLEAGAFFKGVRGVIFEDNQCRSYWPSTHATFEDSARRRKPGEGGSCNLFAECLYMARNQASETWTIDREITSLDSHYPFGFYFGGVERCEGRGLTIGAANADGKPAKLDKGATLAGAAVYVVDGRGAGQYRRIVEVAADGRAITLDRPFQVAPDASSVVSVAKYHGRLLYLDDSFTDGGDVQLWGGAVEAVFRNITMVRCGGYNQTTGFIYDGLIPLWYVEQFDTRVLEGNNPGGPPFKLRPARLSMNTYRHPGFYQGPLIRGAVIRRAVGENNTYAELAGGVDGAVVEHCRIKGSEYGIRIQSADSHYLTGQPGMPADAHERRSPANVLLRGNEFETVAQPLGGDAAGTVEVR